jgi:hypothetical protein
MVDGVWGHHGTVGLAVTKLTSLCTSAGGLRAGRL